MRLAGKVAVVTGGSRGLGREIAGLFVKDGAKVAVCARTPEKTDASDLSDPAGRWYTSWHTLDLEVRAQVEAFSQSVSETYDSVDILVNNVGYGGGLATLADTTEEELDRHIALNLVAPFLLVKRLLPSMVQKDEAWIVNVASQAGKRAVPRMSAYSATKFAMVGMAQALAKELKDTGVNCVTICPAGMATEMRAELFGWENARQQQSTISVATVIRDIVTQAVPVANGAEVLIRDGRIQRIELSPNY